MKKNADMLLTLTPEEREDAREFIERRLSTLEVTQLPQLQDLVRTAKQQIRFIQSGKDRYQTASSRFGKVMAKLYDFALSGLTHLITEGNRTVTAKQRDLKEMQRAHAAGKDQEESDAEGEERIGEIEAFHHPCSAEEEEHALNYIKERVQELRISDLRHFRDASNEIIIWWDSERGQKESLLLYQHGNTNTNIGRMEIREKRDEMRQEVLNPFKAFFQEVNILYQKRNQEATNRARQQDVRQQNMASRDG